MKIRQVIKKHQLYWWGASLNFILLVYVLTAAPSDVLFLLTNFIVMLLALIGMALKPVRVYSLEKVVYVFFFFFMGVVPLNDLYQNNVYWGGAGFKTNTLILTNVFVIIGLLSFFFGAILKFNGSPLLSYFAKVELQRFNKFYFLVIFLGVAFVILYVFNFNMLRLLVRGGANVNFEQIQGVNLNQIQGLIFGNFIRPAPILLLLILHYSYGFKFGYAAVRSKNFSLLWDIFVFVFIFFFTILLIAPTSIPRFLAATLYIPFILIFTKLWDKPYRMQFSIITALLVIMPLLDKFRNFDLDEFDFTFDLSFLNHGHFDAYQNFARVVENDLITYGYQLLGVFFFFVPRNIWPDKPIGSGAFMSEFANYSFSNISMPYIGEGYVNFGVFGVASFMFILGIILNNLDSFVWKLKKTGIKSILIYYYYVLFGLVFFIMRGDLLSSFSFTVGISFSFWGMVFLLRLQRIKILK